MTEKFRSDEWFAKHKEIAGPGLETEVLGREKMKEFLVKNLGRPPELRLHTGSMGLTREEVRVMLGWKDKWVSLREAREESSNYAHAQKVSVAAPPIDIQVARLVSTKGKPEKIWCAVSDVDVWEGEREPTSRVGVIEMPFKEIEENIRDSLTRLNPSYKEKSLREIGGDLREKERKERHRQLVEALRRKLRKPPECYSWLGASGYVEKDDIVTVAYPGKIIVLEQEGSTETEGSHEKPWRFKADPVAVQIARLTAREGVMPEMIGYTRFEVDTVEAGTYKREFPVSGRVKYSEIADDVLAALAEIDPSFKDKSLKEIGKELIEQDKKQIRD